MKSTSHEDDGRIGIPAGHTSALTVRCTVEDALRMSHKLPLTSTDAVLAMVSFTANRMVADNVRNAHAWGELARTQSRSLLGASERMREGPLRDTLAIAARVHAAVGEGIITAASQWGRRYGHLAFALPVPHRSD